MTTHNYYVTLKHADGTWTAAEADQCGDPCPPIVSSSSELGALATLIRTRDDTRTEEQKEYDFWLGFHAQH